MDSKACKFLCFYVKEKCINPATSSQKISCEGHGKITDQKLKYNARFKTNSSHTSFTYLNSSFVKIRIVIQHNII